MRAVVQEQFGSAEVLKVRDVGEPIARSGWVTVRLKASALNWHDVLVREGRYRSPLPHTPGADGAGIRCDTGESVVILPSLFWGERADAPSPNWQILGDTTAGTYADMVSVPVECVFPKPDSLTWPEAAALPLVGVTCHRALFTRARLQAGESLLIIGAGGGVSTMAASLAMAAGAHVTVTASNRRKLDRALASGVHAGLLHTTADWPERARAHSPAGRGFDVVLDPVGLWEKSLIALRSGGRLVVLGANAAESVQIDVRTFYFGQFSLLGTTMGGPQDFSELLAAYALGNITPPVVGAILPLEAAAQAHQRMELGEVFGKIVLINE